MKDDTESRAATERVKEFIAGINKHYSGEVMEFGGRFRALTLSRFSSGILKLDGSLGGGWPFSRVIVVAGGESSGTTLLALKAAEQVMEYDHTTHLHRDFCKAEAFTPGRCLFVDLEGTFDREWAVHHHGWDEDWHVVARPEYAEQAVDIVTTAIREGVFDLVVLDSIAQMTPTAEIEESTEDWQVGLAARLTNKAMRRWVASLNKLSQENSAGGPCVMCLNQMRVNIGVMYGDPRVLPCGKGQRFAASVIVYTKSPKIKDGEDKETATVELGGLTFKNKTYVPQLNFAYEMGLKATAKLGKGEVNNAKQLQAEALRYDLIVKDGTKWRFGEIVESSQKKIMERVCADDALWRQMWRSVVKAATDKVV